ncbi:alpha/beta hydrolase [Actinomadura sp. OS1-43]|nr:alpha/beta hydrolase [Actinomadura sp. OS1-43]
MLQIRTRVRKVSDFVPVVSSVALRRERLAQAAEDDGHHLTAGEHWFAAALLWSLACWPLWETTQELIDIDARKNAAYLKWAAHARHQVERVDIPFQGTTLPAWLHLPPGYDGITPLPTVLACGGMDAPRETVVARQEDGLLARGCAVLAFDGPGQGEAPIHGAHVTPTAWIEAGEALMTWARNRPDIDADRLACWGTSFGSFWITQLAATQPALLGCAAALPVFEPGATTVFEQACPTFKARHMWMAGLSDEAAFDQMAGGYDLRPLVSEMTVPWLVVGGEADELSPVEWVHRLAATCPAPSTLLIYQGARHSMTESMAPVLGPPWRSAIADWIADRIAGREAQSKYLYVTTTGNVEHRPHPRETDTAP